MRIGVTFPQADLELDAIQTRDFAQAVEGMGFDHMLCYDHVLGAGRRTRPDWDRIHDEDHRFHEILVLFGYLAAVTETIELATGVMCLPQRDTALVAKQASSQATKFASASSANPARWAHSCAATNVRSNGSRSGLARTSSAKGSTMPSTVVHRKYGP